MKASPYAGSDFFEKLWEKSWTYIKTVVDVVREPVLILDQDLKVLSANESFYRTFKVDPEDTEGSLVYKLGNGQWDIPELRKLLNDILENNTFFKGFEVSHQFPDLGRKIMILNGRQIYFKEDIVSQPIILLAIEDVTEMVNVAKAMANHTNQFHKEMSERTEKLEDHIKKLERQIDRMMKK